jgi:hypothetical protein
MFKLKLKLFHDYILVHQFRMNICYLTDKINRLNSIEIQKKMLEN